MIPDQKIQIIPHKIDISNLATLGAPLGAPLWAPEVVQKYFLLKNYTRSLYS